MSALSSLLVQDNVVPVGTIEEALQRQVIFGGQLDTNLLELGAVDEQLLVEYKARVAGIPPASVQELELVDPSVVAEVPREVAAAYELLPLRRNGTRLRVAVSGSTKREALEEAARTLGTSLEPVMTSELRLRVALNHHYGIELPRRFSRLSGHLSTPRPGVVSAAATPPTGADGGRPVRPGQARGDADARGEDRILADTMTDFRIDPSVELRDTYPGALSYPDPAGASGATVLPLATGLEMIGSAATRADVFDAALRVMGGMVDYAAIFTVKGRTAYGKASWGKGTISDELARRPVPLEKPGALWTVTRTKAHYLGPLPPNRSNDSLLEAVGRHRPSSVLIVPVVLRNRVVVLIYADCGRRGTQGYELAALLPLASAMASAFERLILSQKRGRPLFSSEPPLPPAGADPAPSVNEPTSARSWQAPADPRSLLSTSPTSDASSAGISVEWRGEGDGLGPGSQEGAAAESASGPAPTSEAPPASEREAGGAPAPRSARSGDGVLVLLTEVLGDPQKHDEPDVGGSAQGARTERVADVPRDSEWRRSEARWTPEPLQPSRSTLVFGGQERESPIELARRKVAERERGADLADPGPTPPPRDSDITVSNVLLVTEKPRKRELTAPAGDVAPDVAPDAGEGVAEAAAPEAAAEQGIDVSPDAGEGAAEAAAPEAAAERGIDLAPDAGEGAAEAAASRVEADEEDDEVSGLPDPRCLESAVEPASVEFSPVGASDDAEPPAEIPPTLEVVSPDAEPAGRARPSSPPVAGSEALTARDAVPKLVDDDVPAEEEPQPDDIEAVADDIIEVTFTEPIREERTELPKSASASGASVVRPSKGPATTEAAALPSVIVDLGEDIEELVERALGEGDDAEEAALELLGAGEAPLPALIRRFPGEVLQPYESLSLPVPPAAKHGRLLALLARYEEQAMHYVLPKLSSADREKRFYAVLLLGELDEDEAIDGVALRLMDADPKVAGLAATLVARHVPRRRFHPAVYQSVRATLTDPKAQDVSAHRAIEAAGVLRDVGSIEGLGMRLRSAKAAQRQAALQSLRLITGQDFGTSARRWGGWWSRNSGRHRAEWLIDALDHRQEPVRARAVAELRRLLPVDFGFDASAPRRDREAACQRYREWWEKEGRRALGGD